MRRVNGWLTMFWLAMIPVSYELGWLKSVVYVSALSLWALVKQTREKEQRERDPLEEKVVKKIVEKTTVDHL